jgi:hypothetical protein
VAKVLWKNFYTWFWVSWMRHGEYADSEGLRKFKQGTTVLPLHGQWGTMLFLGKVLSSNFLTAASIKRR